MKRTFIVILLSLFVFNSCEKATTTGTPSTEPIQTTFGDLFGYPGTYYYVPSTVTYSNGVFYFSALNTTPAAGTYPPCSGNYTVTLKVNAKDTGTYKVYKANYVIISETGFCQSTETVQSDTANPGTIKIYTLDTVNKTASGSFSCAESNMAAGGSFTNLTW